jgi:hypothetical protein
MATGWTVRGSNPGEGEIFRTCPDRPWGPTKLLYNGYRVFLGCKERPGRNADPLPPSKYRGHERVELYLYSPYGPYGLYRASVSVRGCTLPLTSMNWLLVSLLAPGIVRWLLDFWTFCAPLLYSFSRSATV